MTAKHTPPGDGSFRSSMLRNLGGGAALVVFVAAVFFGVGQFAGDEGAPEVAGAAPEQPDPEDRDADEDVEPEPEPEEPEPEPQEPEPEPEPEEPEEAEESDDAADEEPAPEQPEEQPEETEPAVEATEIPRGDISVQVLDGVGTDGGAASQRVASELEGTGYRIIARNPALAYEQTTVLWTSGNEDRARQVAADLGGVPARAQPGNLSEQVDVHVVVGADRA